MAEQWGRRWITIDTSRVALALARQRLLTATFPFYKVKSGEAFMNEGPRRALMNQGPTKHPGSTLRPMMADPRMVLGKVIRAWKAKSAWLIHEAGNLSFAWQSRYHEHVIRNEPELDRIRTYIVNNPLEWDTDVENPKST